MRDWARTFSQAEELGMTQPNPSVGRTKKISAASKGFSEC